MNKENLRKKYKEMRDTLLQDDQDKMSLDIANQALSLQIWDYDYYHIFLPIERLSEINTQYLLSILGGKDKNIIVSKSDFEKGTMKHFLLTDNTKIVVNKMGIPEPQDGIEISSEKLDVVFLPLLAYDKKGNRVGYGKGFYDRFLASCRPNIIKVGLSFFDPETHLIENNKQDIGLNYCISTKKVYNF